MICLIDNSEHPTREDLHRHLRHLKVKQETYYTTYHPRKDRFTGKPLPYKNPEQYLVAEFESKETLQKWICANPVDGHVWAVKWLKRRKEEKMLVYPPTQVELESLMCPPIHYYERNGGYNAICRDLGYQIRFDGKLNLPPYHPTPIIVDSREKAPLPIPGGKVAKLNCGDYGLEGEADKGVYIERKSLGDLVGTLSDRKVRGDDSNLMRFTREIERAAEVGAYIVILVEVSIERALRFNELKEMAHTKVSPEHTFKNLRDLLHRFSNLQALFVNGRGEAMAAVLKLLSAGESVKKVDLQYVYESSQLNLR